MAVRLDFFFISTHADTQKKNGGTLALTLKKNYMKENFFSECHASDLRDTFLHSRDTYSLIAELQKLHVSAGGSLRD